MDKLAFNMLRKTIAFVGASLLSFMLTGVALAVDTNPQQQHTQAQKQNNVQALYKVSVLMGKEIKDKNGEKLGKIVDLVIGRSGQVKYAAFSQGGMLGMKEKMTAIPWNKIQISDEGRYYTLNASKKQLKDAPTFTKESWPNDAQWSTDNTTTHP